MAQAVQFACSLFASRRPKDLHALLTPTAASPRGPSLVSRKHIEPFLNHQKLFPHGVLRAHPAVGAIVGLFKIWKIERRAGAMVASPLPDQLRGKAALIDQDSISRRGLGWRRQRWLLSRRSGDRRSTLPACDSGQNYRYSCSVSSAALPPAAAVLTVTTCSSVKRRR